MPYLLLLKKQQNFKLSSAANIGGAFRVNALHAGKFFIFHYFLLQMYAEFFFSKLTF